MPWWWWLGLELARPFSLFVSVLFWDLQDARGIEHIQGGRGRESVLSHQWGFCLPLVSTYEAGLALDEGISYAVSLTHLASMAHFLRAACLSTKTHELCSVSVWHCYLFLTCLKVSLGNRFHLSHPCAHLYLIVRVEGRCSMFKVLGVHWGWRQTQEAQAKKLKMGIESCEQVVRGPRWKGLCASSIVRKGVGEAQARMHSCQESM